MPRDFGAAAEAYRTACEASPGDGEACWRLASLGQRRRGIELDAPRILALVVRACDVGHVASCASLPIMDPHADLDRGRAAVARLASACATGDTAACEVELGYEARTGATALIAKAVAACRLGSVTGCDRVLDEGGVLADEARRVLVRECDRGVVDACVRVPGRAIPSRSLCAAGDRLACREER